MERRSGAILILSAVLATAAPLTAEENPEVKPRIERVSLFKNGLGYFTSSAALPEKATTIVFGELPVPSLGTFWVSYPKEAKVVGLKTVLEEAEEPRPAQNVGELLLGNVGRKASITTSGGEKQVVEGTILSVTKPPPAPTPSPYMMGLREARRDGYPGYPADSLVLMRTDRGVTAVNLSAIARADIEDGEVQTSRPILMKKARVRMHLEKEAAGQKVVLSYLARGITWSPSYLLDLSAPKNARLTAKAVVLNEVADLDAVRLELVTGFPHLQFADVNDPMAMTQSLAEFLNAIERGRTQESRSGVLAQQMAISSNRTYSQSEIPDLSSLNYAAAQVGTATEDLFLYPVDGFTLRRGETAYVPLFTAEVPYEHVYIWKIPDSLDENERYRARTDREDEPKAEEVWHACRLTNTMKMPWTTAPAEFVKDGQITGQDTCYFAPAGAKTTVRINRAMNVVADRAEFEVERKRAASTFYGTAYDRVKVRGELKLKNKLEETVTVEVTKALSGEVLEKTPEAKDIPTAEGLKRVNSHHELVWEIALKPGEEKKMTYVYEVYVPG